MTPERMAELRAKNERATRGTTHYDGCANDHALCAFAEALDALESAQAENARLREALEEIAEHGASNHDAATAKIALEGGGK